MDSTILLNPYKRHGIKLNDSRLSNFLVFCPKDLKKKKILFFTDDVNFLQLYKRDVNIILVIKFSLFLHSIIELFIAIMNNCLKIFFKKCDFFCFIGHLQ